MARLVNEPMTSNMGKLRNKCQFCHYILRLLNPCLGFPGGTSGNVSANYVRGKGLIPGSGRSPGGGHGNPFRYSCLENPWTEEPGEGYSQWGHKRVRHDLETKQ